MTTYGTIPTSIASSSTSDYLSLAKHRIRTGFSTRRPWKLMFRLHSLRLPGGFSDAVSRVFANAAFFRANYAIVVLFVLFLSLLWRPISLIVFIAMAAAWLFLYFLRDEPVAVFGRAIDDRVVLVVLFVLTLVFLFLTGATENILVALLIGVVAVLVHAVVRKTDDLEIDEEGGGSGGLIAGDGASSSST